MASTTTTEAFTAFQMDSKPEEPANMLQSVSIPRNGYEQPLTVRERRLNNRKESIEKVLKESLPYKFIIFHAVALIVLALIAVVFQTLMIVFKYAFYFIGSGYWVSAYFLILVVISIVLIKRRTYCMYLMTVILNFFGIFLSIGGLSVVYALSLQSGVMENLSNIYLPVIVILVGVLGTIELFVFTLFMICIVKQYKPTTVTSFNSRA